MLSTLSFLRYPDKSTSVVAMLTMCVKRFLGNCHGGLLHPLLIKEELLAVRLIVSIIKLICYNVERIEVQVMCSVCILATLSVVPSFFN